MANLSFAGLAQEGNNSRTLDADLYNTDSLNGDIENIAATGNLNIGNVLRYDAHTQRHWNDGGTDQQHHSLQSVHQLMTGSFLAPIANGNESGGMRVHGEGGAFLQTAAYSAPLQEVLHNVPQSIDSPGVLPLSVSAGPAATPLVPDISPEAKGGGNTSNTTNNGGTTVVVSPGGDTTHNDGPVINTTNNQQDHTSLLEQTTTILGDTVTNVTNTVGDTLGDVTNTINNVLGDTLGDTLAPVTNILDQIVDTAEGTPLGGTVDAVAGIVNGAVPDLIDMLGDGNVDPAEVVNFVSDTINQITDLVGGDNEAVNSVVAIAQDTLDQITGLLPGGGDVLGQATEIVQDGLGQITDIIGNTQGLEGLQPVMDAANDAVSNILSVLEGDAGGDAVAQVTDIATSALEQVSGLLGGGDAGEAVTDIGDVVTSAVNDIAGMLSTDGSVDAGAVVAVAQDALAELGGMLGTDNPAVNDVMNIVGNALTQAEALLEPTSHMPDGTADDFVTLAQNALTDITEALQSGDAPAALQEAVDVAGDAVSEIASVLDSGEGTSGDITGILSDALGEIPAVAGEDSPVTGVADLADGILGDSGAAAVVITDAVDQITAMLGGDTPMDAGAIVAVAQDALDQIMDMPGAPQDDMANAITSIAQDAIAQANEALAGGDPAAALGDVLTVASNAMEEVGSVLQEGGGSPDVQAAVEIAGDAVTELADALNGGGDGIADAVETAIATLGVMSDTLDTGPVTDMTDSAMQPVDDALSQVAQTLPVENIAPVTDTLETVIAPVDDTVSQLIGGPANDVLDATGLGDALGVPLVDANASTMDSGFAPADDNALVNLDLTSLGGASDAPSAGGGGLLDIESALLSTPDTGSATQDATSLSVNTDALLPQVSVPEISMDIPVPQVQDIPLAPSIVDTLGGLTASLSDTGSDSTDSAIALEALQTTTSPLAAIDVGTLFTDTSAILGGGDGTTSSASTSGTSSSSSISSIISSIGSTTTTEQTVAAAPPPPPPPVQTVTHLIGGLFGHH